jgi:beta-barrel assembly-enhancing protease
MFDPMLLTAFLITIANFQELAAIDRNVIDVGRRLAAGSADLCSGYVSNPGWTLADVEQYAPVTPKQADYRRMATAALSLRSMPTVVFVQAGSAAARAGVLPGDAVLSVNGQAIAESATAKPSRTRLAHIERSIPVRSVRVRRNGGTIDFEIAPERGCPSHFLIGRARGLRGVSSDGRNVGVSAEMLEYVRRNDDELALILAHELAHNILGHNKGVPAFRAAGEDRSGRSKKSREAEADRWALYLMARAGYDVSVAPGFWRRWGPKTSFGLFNSGSHPGWRDRAAAAEAEIARIKAQQQAGQRPVP